MAEEVLSQGEIDALLNAISSGSMDADELKEEKQKQKVKLYDFKRALRFSKDQIRGLTRVHENFARLLTTYFSAQLRTHVSISIASVDQVPYEEFIRSIPKRTVLNVFSVSPLEGRVLFEVNPNVAYAMLDRMLGGKGSNFNKVENLTEIETKIMTKTYEKAMKTLEEAWSTMVEIDTYLEEFEINPQFLQMVSPNETVIVISLNTTIGDSSGMINICIPHMVLEPIISKLSVHYWMENQSNKIDPENYKNLTGHLKKVKTDVRAILGESSMTIEDFLNLAKDDVIKLDRKIDDPLTLFVNQEPKFYAQVGKKKNKLAVQILDEFNRGEDDDEQ